MTTHTYRSTLAWAGSTGIGYDDYDRTHRVALPPAAGELRVSSDAAFRGDPGLMNPEGLLLAAASSCQLLSFLALAARSRLDVVAYHDDADAVMPEAERPVRITRIVLRPHVVVARGTDHARVRRLVDRAHDQCYVANTLRAQVDLEATVADAEGS